MERPGPKHKGIYILPNLFTTLSLFSGFLGLLWASNGQFDRCAMAIFFSALMDGLDGKVARLTGTASAFGVQYDSLSDLVAFGLTPAFMMQKYALFTYNRVGIAIAFLFAVCGALRLARFNVSTGTANKMFFTGLPIPAGGCVLAAFVLFTPYLPEFMRRAVPGMCLGLTFVIALLMVSRVRYASFKEFGVFKAHPFRTMVSVIVLFALIVTNPRIFIFLILLGYVVFGIFYTLVIMPRSLKKAEAKDPGPTETPQP